MVRASAAAASAAWADLRRVPRVDEDPLVADDADEVDEDGEQIEEGGAGDDGDDEADEGEDGERDGVDRAEVEAEDGGDASYGVLPEIDDEPASGACGDASDASPLRPAEQPAAGSRKRGKAARNLEAQLPPADHEGGSAAPDSAAAATDAPPPKTKKKAKSEYVLPTEQQEQIVYFCTDLETTSNNRKQYDRVIEVTFVAYTAAGVELGRWEARFTNVSPLGTGLVPISDIAFSKHKISADLLKDKPEFKERAPDIVAFFEEHLQAAEAGVLCAHNGESCDFRFLAVEMARAGCQWPAKLKYSLDTYLSMGRFKSLDYHKAGEDATKWPTRTDTGKPSFSVEPTVDYILKVRGAFGKPPDAFASFQSVCGEAHGACADAMGVAVIWFDKGAGAVTLQSKWKEQLFKPMKVWIDLGKELLEKPLVTHEVVASGWEEMPELISGDSGDEAEPTPAPTKASVKEEFEKAEAEVKPMFKQVTPTRAGQPGPSPAFCAYLLSALRIQALAGLATVDLGVLLATIFFYFFTEELLAHVVKCTNARAMEPTVLVTENGKKIKRKPRDSDPSHLPRVPRIKGWVKLTVAELIVWLGCLLKMGVSGKRRRAKHYWSNEPGLRDEDIASAMRRARFEQIYAQLSFMMTDSTEYLTDKLRKIRWVNNYLAARVDMCMRFLTLLGDSAFDHRGFVVFMDSYFVMIKLFVALAARGIYAVGPCKAKRPEKKAGPASWPFQSYEKTDLQFLDRGWRRVCSRPLEAGGRLYAAVWKDNKAVTLLFTAFHSTAKVFVPRWVGTERQRRYVPSFLGLVMYATYWAPWIGLTGLLPTPA